MNDEWSRHAVLQDLGLLVTAVSGILSIIKSTFHFGRSPSKKPGQSEPRRSKRKISWAWLSAGLIFLSLCGLFLALNLYSEKIPLVMVGSGNVQSFLTERVPNFYKLRPVMIDVGSGAGFNLVLQAAQFGDNPQNAKNAEVIVALSSSGDAMFEQALKSAPAAQGSDNAWLSVEIATPPSCSCIERRSIKLSRSLYPQLTVTMSANTTTAMSVAPT